MGMFDSFYAPATCPDCKRDFLGVEFQTKQGVCDLLKFRVGQLTQKHGTGIQTGEIDVDFYCPSCFWGKKWNNRPNPPRARLYIRDWVFLGAKVEGSSENYDLDEDVSLPSLVATNAPPNLIAAIQDLINSSDEHDKNMYKVVVDRDLLEKVKELLGQ